MRYQICFVMALLATPCAALAEDDDAKATTLAKELLEKGSEIFDKRDAPAMAATYLESGQIILIKKESDSGRINTEIRSGRAAIESTYADIFKDRQPEHKSRNTVESAHFVNEDVLLIRGRFALNRDQGDALRFVQVRAREGTEWKIATLQLMELPK